MLSAHADEHNAYIQERGAENVDENNTAEGELEKIGGHLADVLTTTVHKRCDIAAWRKSYETLVSAIALVYVPCRP